MLQFLPIQVEVALFVAGVVLLLAYALLAGNGSPAQESNGRRFGQPLGAAYAGGLPVVVTLGQTNARLHETLAMHWRPMATTPIRAMGSVPASAAKQVWEYAGTTDIQAEKRSAGERRSRVSMSLKSR